MPDPLDNTPSPSYVGHMTMSRIATILVTIAAVLTLGAGPAQATKRAEGGRHPRTVAAASWIQPPTNLDTFRNIYGSKADGFIADHIDTSTGGWVNTMWPARRVILFQYCPGAAHGPNAVFACQTAWDGFYTWMMEHRDGTKADWIELQYP